MEEVFAMMLVFCGFTAAKIIKLSEFCRKTCSNFAFFFLLLQLQINANYYAK
jgi:hypothetical protein